MKLSRTIDLKSTLSVPFSFGTRPPFEPTGSAAARIMSLTSYQAAPPRFDRCSSRGFVGRLHGRSEGWRADTGGAEVGDPRFIRRDASYGPADFKQPKGVKMTP